MHIDELIIKDQFFDRRYKILDCHREMIPIWVDSGRSIKSIAQMLNVSYSTIYFIANPDKAELNKELGIKRGGSAKYYDKDKHTESVTKHRKYKQKIFNSIMEVDKKNLEVGKIYDIISQRKGRFTMRLTHHDETWASGIITKGKADAICAYNEVENGEEVTVRKHLTAFIATS